MTDPRLLSAEEINYLCSKLTRFPEDEINIIQSLMGHITAQAEQIKELQGRPTLEEFHVLREMLAEKDSLREELDRTNEITIEVMKERDEARNKALEEAAKMIDENYSQTLADAIRTLKAKETQ